MNATQDNNGSGCNNDNSSNGGVDEEEKPSVPPIPPTLPLTVPALPPTLPSHLLVQLQWVARAPVHTTLACGGNNTPGGDNTALGLGAVGDEGAYGWLAAASSAGVTLWM